MDAQLYKSKITETFEKVRRLSFEEKKAALYDEAKINKLLDTILGLKEVFNDRTDKINLLVENIEGITWYTDLDNDSLMLINDLISAIRDLHSSLLRLYISMGFMRSKGIAKTEIRNFKTAIDDLKDIAGDLESVFFFLPSMPDFRETTKELSLV